MPTLDDILLAGRIVGDHRPWRRSVVSVHIWQFVIQLLAEGKWTLLGLWGEPSTVHMALMDEVRNQIAVISLECPTGRFPSVAASHPPAARLERTIRDLFGLIPEGALDERPWLSHGRWRASSAHAGGADDERVGEYAFLAADGEGLHQVAVGPVHAGIIEPGHFRFTANGETVVRLEERLGYVHKGIESLMVGADLGKAVKLAGRTSGDSTVAYALCFSRAVEAALGIEIPIRATWLRALMAELERVANHLGDIGAICNDAAFALMLAHCGILREKVLRAADRCFGHRLMRDCITPGGAVTDLGIEGMGELLRLVAEIRNRFTKLVELYDGTASLQDRTVGTGKVTFELVRQYGCGGYIGRASGRQFDARHRLRYAPYDKLQFQLRTHSDGDVNARVWIRIWEVLQALSFIEQILGQMPQGAIRREFDSDGPAREGMAIVEGFRGDILVWLRLADDGRIDRCHLRDPSWFQWPLLEAAIEGNIIADFPLCNKSFNCSYSGHDL
ncbi:MAG TPA: nickel-dependent hydrogenase large subunit [Dongiaceae bacterium]|nr:nickel-dependent hydrogenase large subunit [Dongiaceae bacterium]